MSGGKAGRKRGRRGRHRAASAKDSGRGRSSLAQRAGSGRGRWPPKKTSEQGTMEGGKAGRMPTKRGARTPLKKKGGQNWGRAVRNCRRGAVCGGALLLLIMAKSVGCYSHPRFAKKIPQRAPCAPG